MSEEVVSPNPRFDKKSSLKKSSKPDHSKSKKKPIEVMDPTTTANEKNTLQTTVEEKPDPKLQSKSSKREALQNKGDSKFKEHLKQAERSEKSAKAMKSTDKASTIKENHNHIESNQRQFSLSKEPEALDVSKKKIATQSKKSKVQETGTKHPKTQEKALVRIEQSSLKEPNKSSIEDGLANPNLQNELEKKPIEDENNAENKPEDLEKEDSKGNLNSKSALGSSKRERPSRKRPQILQNTTEVQDRSQDGKKSKSVKNASKSAAKSKDSKASQGRSGVKKLKPNEEKAK